MDSLSEVARKLGTRIRGHGCREVSQKKESEGIIMAAQDQALRTNSVKKPIDNQNVSPACRMSYKHINMQNV